MTGLHPSHKTRFSMDASTYDEICVYCGATDEVPGGWGRLASPCPSAPPPPVPLTDQQKLNQIVAEAKVIQANLGHRLELRALAGRLIMIIEDRQ